MWFRLKSFVGFYLRAATIYNVQSPFLYDFIQNVLDTHREYYIFKRLESLRLQLKISNEVIQQEDYGAGSVYRENNRGITLGRIARTALSNEKKCRILFNLVNFVNASSILELGTSAGLSSAYLAAANRSAKVITLEGNKALVKTAKQLHKDAGLQNIEILQGEFEENLTAALEKLTNPDLVFIDGNHRYDATIQYFKKILPYCHNRSIVVLDDIYWSEEMQRAWNEIKKLPEVTLSLDIYELGFVFVNRDLSKEDISIIHHGLKPWRIGLFGK